MVFWAGYRGRNTVFFFSPVLGGAVRTGPQFKMSAAPAPSVDIVGLARRGVEVPFLTFNNHKQLKGPYVVLQYMNPPHQRRPTKGPDGDSGESISAL